MKRKKKHKETYKDINRKINKKKKRIKRKEWNNFKKYEERKERKWMTKNQKRNEVEKNENKIVNMWINHLIEDEKSIKIPINKKRNQT